MPHWLVFAPRQGLAYKIQPLSQLLAVVSVVNILLVNAFLYSRGGLVGARLREEEGGNVGKKVVSCPSLQPNTNNVFWLMPFDNVSM